MVGLGDNSSRGHENCRQAGTLFDLELGTHKLKNEKDVPTFSSFGFREFCCMRLEEVN